MIEAVLERGRAVEQSAIKERAPGPWSRRSDRSPLPRTISVISLLTGAVAGSHLRSRAGPGQKDDSAPRRRR
jgi:hypothetical protein